MRARVNSLVVIVLACLVAPLLPTSQLQAQSDFIRGDCNIDGGVDIGDVSWILLLGWIDGPPPACEGACDADGDGVFNTLLEAVWLLSYLYTGGAAPPAPFPACGPDVNTSLTCANYDCDPAGPQATDSYIFALADAVGGTGLTAEVPVTLEILPDNHVVAWSYGVCHDPSALSLEQMIPGDDLAALNDGDGPEFSGVELFDSGWTAAVLISFFILSEEQVGEVRVAEYTVLAPLGTITPLEFCDTLGDPPVAITIVEGTSATSIPTTVAGSMEVVPAFRRGDADADGVVNVLADAIYLLSFGFMGGPPPPCDDAVDVDDNGVLNSLSDGLALLSYGFLGGPPPAPPGIVCGVDPTPDVLGCTTYSDCP